MTRFTKNQFHICFLAMSLLSSVALEKTVAQNVVMREYATVFGSEFYGERMASGDRYDPSEMIAAHRTYPLGTLLRLTHPESQRSVDVKVVDKMLPVESQNIRLSLAAAQMLAMEPGQSFRVNVTVISAESTTGQPSTSTTDLASTMEQGEVNQDGPAIDTESITDAVSDDVDSNAMTDNAGEDTELPDFAGARFAEPLQEGLASYYGERFNGRSTASGEIFDMDGFTAAHPSLPFGTILEVENQANGNTVRVRVNDRGPFTGNRILDISRGAARELDMIREGVAKVTVYMIEPGATDEDDEMPVAIDENVEDPASSDDDASANDTVLESPVIESGNYTVLLYSLSNIDRANQQAELFPEGWVQETTEQGVTRYFVNIGRYESVGEANQKLQELSNRGYVAFVKVINPGSD